jgi:hypothetical protein
MRTMSADMLAALQSSQLNPALFVEMHFVSSVVYAWSGLGTISWNGHSWQGVGALGSVSTIAEGGVVEAKGLVLTLSGIDVSMLANVLQEFRVGAPVVVNLGLFDSGGTLIASPITSWAGRMDQPTIDVGAETATISINCENRLLELNVASDKRYTNEQQIADHPLDEAFKFVAGCQQRQISWGRIPSLVHNPIFS